MARVCVDTCFLIGLYDKDDQHHKTAARHFQALFGEESGRHQLIAPWPILYECLGSKYERQPQKSVIFRQHWSYLHEAGQLVLLDDGQFRNKPLDDHLGDRLRPLSLVDRVLREMILGRSKLFDYFLTYKTGDFSDACQLGDIPLINERSSAESYGI